MNTKKQNRRRKPSKTGELVGVDVPRLVGCRRCDSPGARGGEHRTIHIDRMENMISLAFIDGAGIGIRKDNPWLAEEVGRWFLNEIDELPADPANAERSRGGLRD